MKRSKLITLWICSLVIISLNGCSETTPAPSQTPTTSSVKTSPLVISGNDNSTSKPFNLQKGFAVFNIQYAGIESFIVTLLDSNGDPIGSPANVKGNYSGSQAFLSEGGPFSFKVQTSGPWNITVTQPNPTIAPEVSSLSGKGPTATKIFHLTSGDHTFNMTHDGQSKFIVNLLGSQDNSITFITHEDGNYNGSQTVQVKSNGLYLFNIEADGNWTVGIK